MHRFGISRFYQDPQYGTWKGYRLIAGDGSSLRLPNSKEIISQFGLCKPNGTDGKMPPIAKISLFVDLYTSFICSARIAPWRVGEQALAAEQLPEVVSYMRQLNHENLMFIYDRGYPSMAFMHQHAALEVDFLFRLQRGMYPELWQRVDAGKTDFDITITQKKTQQNHTVRVIAFTLPNGVLEVLATSLFDRTLFTLPDLGKVYKLRWHIEECYKRLKIGAELENFSGLNLEAVLQEFWAHMAICNILAAHMCDTQGCWDLDNLPNYRLNFFLFGVMREKVYQVLIGKLSPDIFEKFFYRAVARAKVKVRPHRLYSRHKVDIPKRDHVFRKVC